MVQCFDIGRSFITGLGHEYPTNSIGQADFETIIKTLYPSYFKNPGLQKLLYFNRTTRIDTRRTVFDYSKWTVEDADPPSINQLSRIFRTVGVDLATAACVKALSDSKLSISDITHTVAVTCTDQGNPGYDLLVCKKLGLNSNVQRVLLHGVGCAGGLSALRTAADITACESQRGRHARVLVMSCELCSLFLRAELESAAADQALHIAPAMFGDAASAVIVCNQLGLGSQKPVFELEEWGSAVVPETSQFMSYDIEAHGMLATITKEVASTAVNAIRPMFQKMVSGSRAGSTDASEAAGSSFDWAIHPGGAAILKGAQEKMDLSDDHIRASLEVYKTYGNSSSSAVLIVMDKLRQMGRGRDKVIAASFGPGIMIEMFRMRRCRESDAVSTPPSAISRLALKWMGLRSRIVRLVDRSRLGHEPRRIEGAQA